MARAIKNQTKVCTVTGMETSVNNFYAKQNHIKAVDNQYNYLDNLDYLY